MDRSKFTAALLLATLASSNIAISKALRTGETIDHAPSTKIIHEPKSIISYQKNKTAKAKRLNMSNRLGLVEAKLREMEQEESAARAFARVSTHLALLKQKYNVDDHVDPQLLMSPLEQTYYKRRSATLNQQRQRIESRRGKHQRKQDARALQEAHTQKTRALKEKQQKEARALQQKLAQKQKRHNEKIARMKRKISTRKSRNRKKNKPQPTARKKRKGKRKKAQPTQPIERKKRRRS